MSRCRLLAVGVTTLGAAMSAAPAQAALGDRLLRQGMSGHDVRVLQDFLTRVGLETEVDGEYGPYTARRVRSWERRSEVTRVNGRLERRDARKLRGQVDAGITVVTPTPEAPAGNPTEKAVLGPDGLAIAPDSAPQQVKDVIASANEIVGKPYKYGGGHGQWEDSGYDCSGSMSYALHGAGLLNEPLTSSGFESYGDAGEGQWISTYGSGGHSFMVVAGLRFDTGFNEDASDGPKWSERMRPGDGYVARHPEGL